MFLLSLLRITRSHKLNHETVIVILAVYFGVVLNFPFNQRIMALSGDGQLLFSLTPALVLSACFTIIFSLFPSRFVFKPIMVFLLCTSAAAMYATLKYNILFDYSMIENIFETNSGEAESYLNAQSILYVLLLGILPSIWLLKTKIIRPQKFYMMLLRRLGLIVASIIVIGLVAAFFYKDYASVGRNNKYLNKMITPAHVYNIVRYIDRNYFTTPLPYHIRGLDAKMAVSTNNKPTLLVVMLGETARAQNFFYNGYTRNTNPYTQDLDIISFQHVSSCGTATAHSLPCMFSSFTRNNYSKDKANAQDNVLDIINHAGADVTWFDNDGGDKKVASHIIKHEISTDKINTDCNGSSCYDDILVQKLSTFIDTQSKKVTDNVKNQLVVMHTIGSHGPTYYQRYPIEKEEFTPACRRSDIENCSDQEIVNVYDNTIAYTDYVLSEIIKELKSVNDQYNVAMVYISDHGESLGENGLYLHGTPYTFAPQEQTHVPWLMWLPEQFASAQHINANCIRQEAKTEIFSHDNLFHTLLGLFNISTTVKDNELDITNACKTI